MKQMIFKCPEGRDDVGGFKTGDIVCAGSKLLEAPPGELPDGARWVGSRRFEQWVTDGFLVEQGAAFNVPEEPAAQPKAGKSKARGRTKWPT